MKIKYLKLIFHGMMVFGIWPYWNNKKIQKLHAYSFIAYQAIIVISLTGGFFNCGNSLTCYLETACYFLVHGFGFYCALTLYLKYDSIKYCLKRLHLIVATFGYNSFVERGDKHARYLIIFCYTYLSMGVLLFNNIAIVTYDECMESTLVMAAPCGMPVTVTLPINFDNNPQYGIVFLLVITGGYFAIFSVVLGFLLPFSMLLHIKQQIEYLKDNLRKLSKNKFKDQNYKLLKYCVKHHIYITTYLKDVQETFSEIIFFAFTSMSLALSIYTFQCIYYLLHGYYLWLMKYSVLLSGYSLILAVFCTIGEVCEACNEELVDVIYDVRWYEETLQSQYLIKFMLMRSQKSLALHVKGMGFVNNKIMSTILKTTYSYSTVLINIVFRSLED